MLEILNWTLRAEWFTGSVINYITENKNISDKGMKDIKDSLKKAEGYLFNQKTVLYGYLEITSEQLKNVMLLDGWRYCDDDSCYKVQVMEKTYCISLPSDKTTGIEREILMITALTEYERFERMCKSIFPHRKTTGILPEYYVTE